MKTLKMTSMILAALSLFAVSAQAGIGTSQITSVLDVDKDTCKVGSTMGKRFYDRGTDSFTRHCSQQ